MPRALYFGCWDEPGHFLHDERGLSVYFPSTYVVGFPWSDSLMDGGLLANGKIADLPDGRVRWTCARRQWFAFYWWDRSGDSRGASNSGFLRPRAVVRAA